MGRRYLFGFLLLATAVAGYAMVRLAGNGGLQAATSPDWKLLAAGFVICAAVQPLRALAWSSTSSTDFAGYGFPYGSPRVAFARTAAATVRP